MRSSICAAGTHEVRRRRESGLALLDLRLLARRGGAPTEAPRAPPARGSVREADDVLARVRRPEEQPQGHRATARASAAFIVQLALFGVRLLVRGGVASPGSPRSPPALGLAGDLHAPVRREEAEAGPRRAQAPPPSARRARSGPAAGLAVQRVRARSRLREQDAGAARSPPDPADAREGLRPGVLRDQAAAALPRALRSREAARTWAQADVVTPAVA